MKLFYKYTVTYDNGTYYRGTRMHPLISLTILGIVVVVWYMYGRNIIDFIFRLVGI